ncbi:MAG TPA: radical SAM protein [Oscillatoriaceae cyanobacterium]
MTTYVDQWRRRKSEAFDLAANSTGGRTVDIDLWGVPRTIYANANLSIYSAQACNARCAFCVEELRPASRGTALVYQKSVEQDDARYFAALESTLRALAPLNPSLSITGGEPSIDPRLPRILRTVSAHAPRKLVMTTNGSGLLQKGPEGRPLDHLIAAGAQHLNLSRAHWDDRLNARLMGFKDAPDAEALRAIVRTARAGGLRVRLSCVLLADAVDDLEDVLGYLEFARSVGVDNVIFRRLMQVDRATVEENYVVRYCDQAAIALEPLLDQLGTRPDFTLQQQIVGYYYYVEVWRWHDVDVVFEEADLAQLEHTKRTMPGVIHELIFHPNARLASTWQPWDGVLGPLEPG